MPKKLRFPIWGEPPKPGTYIYPGITFLDVRCTTTALDAWRRFSLPEKCSWYSNGNILPLQYLGLSNCAAQYFGTRRCSLCTHSTQNLQGWLRCPKGLKLCASLSLSPTGATVRDIGQGTCIARIYDHHRAIGLAAVKVRPARADTVWKVLMARGGWIAY
jgi:hypothetical protein